MSSLRDIWAATDRISIDVMKGAGGVPPSSAASVVSSLDNDRFESYLSNYKTEPLVQNNCKSPQFLTGPFLNAGKEGTDNDAEKFESYLSHYKTEPLVKINSESPQFLTGPFLNVNKEGADNDDDDTASLLSIWTPTLKDKVITEQNGHKNPLLALRISEKGTPRHASKSIISTDDAYETCSSSNSDSEVTNNYGSDESQDEHNEETFGEFAALPGEFRPNDSELCLIDLSDVTSSCDFLTKPSATKTAPSLKSNESKDSDNSEITVIETKKDSPPPTKSETLITKVYSENSLQFQTKPKSDRRKYACNGSPKYRRRPRRSPKKALPSQFLYESMDSTEVLSVSRENLTIKETRSFSGQVGKRSPNVRRRMAFETREVIGKRGNTTQKITYVQGKIIENSNGTAQDYHQKNLAWNDDIFASKSQNRDKVFNSKSFTRKMPPNYLRDSGYSSQHRSKETNFDLKHIKNGRVVTEGCLEVNKHSNYNGYETKEHFSYPRQFMENLGGKTIKDYSNVLGNQTSFKNMHTNLYFTNRSPNELACFPTDTMNKSYIDKRVTNATQSKGKFRGREKLHDELSWNIVGPEEKESEKGKSDVNEILAVGNREDLPPRRKIPNPHKIRIEINPLKKKDSLKKYSPDENHQEDNFVFFENLRSGGASKESETLVKEDRSVLKGRNSEIDELYEAEIISRLRSVKLKEERAGRKSVLIRDGKEVADLIVGSHTALDVFSSFYREWRDLRMQSILLLEQLSETIIHSSGKSDKIRDIIAGMQTAAGVAALVPHKAVSIGARIAAAVGGFVAKLFGPGFTKKDRDAKEFEVRQTFQQDIDTSSMVYIYGVQCGSQFQETTQYIVDFHRRIQQEDFDLFMTDQNVLEFMREISEYSPTNVSVFYRRLRLGYEKLIKRSNSDESRAFIRVFEDIPGAVPIITLLPWRFEPDGFDNSIVLNAWEELFALFYDSGSSDINLFLRKIQNCLFFLKKEKTILERNVRNLIN